MGYDNEIAFSSVVAVQSGWWRLCKNGILRSSFLSTPFSKGARGLLMMGLRGRWWWGGGLGGLGGQQAVCAWRSLGSRLLGGGPRIRGVQARAAFINLCVQLGRTLEVNTVEHLKRDQTGEITTTCNSGHFIKWLTTSHHKWRYYYSSVNPAGY